MPIFKTFIIGPCYSFGCPAVFTIASCGVLWCSAVFRHTRLGRLRTGCNSANDVLASRRPATFRATTANDEADDEAEKNNAADDRYRDVVQTSVQSPAIFTTVLNIVLIISKCRRQLCQCGRHWSRFGAKYVTILLINSTLHKRA